MKKTYAHPPMLMDVEPTGGGIGALNRAWPTGDEPVAQGDDHIRVIKDAIQNTWPNVGSDPITANEQQQNDTFENLTVDGPSVADKVVIGSTAHQDARTERDLEVTRDLEVLRNVEAVGDITAFSTGVAQSHVAVVNRITAKGSLHSFLHALAVEADKVVLLEQRIQNLETTLHVLTKGN